MIDHNTIRIIIADDHKLFRNGLISLLRDHHEIYIVEEAENGKELIEKSIKYKPDVVVADISMPILTGIEAAEKIKEKDDSIRILFLSMFEGKEYVYLAWKSGAFGMVSKNIMTDELIYAIKKVYNREYYFGVQWDDTKLHELIDSYNKLRKTAPKNFHYSLTKREEEILTLINEGHTSIEIASTLNLSRRTIDTHRSNIMQKLNIHSLQELIKYAMEHTKVEAKVEKQHEQ
jgi:DNA-binding NarL/FixJ family response regulator